ncbi:VOC family protein [Chishuiella sp.]|uniref:VOC family protein n=1 Tax=Chishuiella sp. TaxID=1969467 RepID=UPI0028AB9DFB|nr:VOC family protein [Chishuiella sp.]
MKNNLHGIDHIGITVPDIDKATEFFVKGLDAVVLYDTYTKDQPPRDSDFTRKRLGIEDETAELAIRMLALPNGPGLELFEFYNQHQNGPITPADIGFQHLAIYVDDMNEALQKVEAAGAKRNSDPVALNGLEEGKGNVFCYCKTPWGSSLELISYPTKQPYTKFSPREKWKV